MMTGSESFKTSIHLNVGDNLNSSGQSNGDESEEDDVKLLQFKRVFKHLEDLESNLSELNKYKKNKKPQKIEVTIKNDEQPHQQQPNFDSIPPSPSSARTIKSESEFAEFSSDEKKTLAYKKMNDILNNSRHRCERKKEYKETMTQYSEVLNHNTSPFFYADNTKSPSLDEKIIETRKETEGKLLKYEVSRLRNELDDLKSYNSRFYAKTTTLEQKIDDINLNISKKKADIDIRSPNKVQNYEEFEFIEKDKILKDLCQSKILLEKTSHLTPETSSKPPIYQQSKPSTPYQNMSSSYQTSSGSLSSSPQYHSRVRSNNFLPNTSNSNYFSSDSFTHSKTVESQNFSRFTNSLNGMDLFKNSVLIDSNISNINSEPSSYPIEIVHQKPNRNSSFSSNSQRSMDQQPLKSSLKQSKLEVKLIEDNEQNDRLRKEFDQIKKDLENAQNENKILKKKVLESKTENHEKIESSNQMSHEILTSINGTEKLSNEQMHTHRQTLKSVIQDLNNQNLNLKNKLNRLQSSNAKGLEKLKHFYNENNKLKTELKLITERKLNENSTSAKTTYTLNTQIKNLNNKLKFEESQRDELKKRYDVEINAAKIRYENELQKQSSLMQHKNAELMAEINRLNESIKKLQNERNSLLAKLKSDITDVTSLKSTSFKNESSDDSRNVSKSK